MSLISGFDPIGKTALIHQYTQREFLDVYQPTIEDSKLPWTIYLDCLLDSVSVTYYLLLIILIFIIYYLLFIIYYLLFIIYYSLFIIYYLSFIICYLFI